MKIILSRIMFGINFSFFFFFDPEREKSSSVTRRKFVSFSHFRCGRERRRFFSREVYRKRVEEVVLKFGEGDFFHEGKNFFFFDLCTCLNLVLFSSFPPTLFFFLSSFPRSNRSLETSRQIS